jgi:hypothetical protein
VVLKHQSKGVRINRVIGVIKSVLVSQHTYSALPDTISGRIGRRSKICRRELPVLLIGSPMPPQEDLEPNKWVKQTGWGDCAEARRLIMEAIARCKQSG